MSSTTDTMTRTELFAVIVEAAAATVPNHMAFGVNVDPEDMVVTVRAGNITHSQTNPVDARPNGEALVNALGDGAFGPIADRGSVVLSAAERWTLKERLGGFRVIVIAYDDTPSHVCTGLCPEHCR